LKKLKIGIFGVGAIGSVVSFLIEEGHDMYYYNRSSRTEIRVERAGVLCQRNISLSTVEQVFPLDWLVICIKEYHYVNALVDIKQLVQPETKIVVIRNGLFLSEPLLLFTSRDHILECMIDCPTQICPDGHFLQLRKAKMIIESVELAEAWKRICTSDNCEIHITEDFLSASWKKLIESSALGSIQTLSGEASWIFMDREVEDLYIRIAKEGIHVAKASGAKIEDNFLEKLLVKLKRYPSDKESSMLTDRKLGRPIEIYAKNGLISRMGKKYGIDTEINNLITTLLRRTNSNQIK